MRWSLYLICVSTLAAGCSQDGRQPESGDSGNKTEFGVEEPSDGPERLKAKHLPNAVRVHDKVISGGVPEGDAAFEELRDLGVKTIISVDGARPDLETAARYALKYVHLPHGYDGIPDQRVMQLAKAVRDLDGPIYIHCHHGKHRSPAAASVACVAAGFLSPSLSLSVLKLAGTSPNYRGLYESAKEAVPLEKALLDDLAVEFRETVEVPPMAEAMVAIEQTHDRLLEIAEAGWQTPDNHPDLVPAHEALLLREHFAELLRADHVREQTEEFHELLRASASAARELEDGLRKWKQAPGEKGLSSALADALDRITSNCKACHQIFRDVPLGSDAR